MKLKFHFDNEKRPIALDFLFERKADIFELEKTLLRAMNTWEPDKRPQWVQDLYDTVRDIAATHRGKDAAQQYRERTI